ncbi:MULTISPECIES: energy transducer TonB [Halomonadaceae]|uniref:Protein TonB n=1 Tax=Vreelandella halophila TaxID=86177 RepID=A0A9X4YDZ6_9GAMM|nr:MULTISPECIES: energy transducer TonB [Halomonas]MYL27932.1 TonB family protein [Halomonas utahensis]MYL75058.1 TonB family protein [Halomonas sp. 22501_18_FS]
MVAKYVLSLLVAAGLSLLVFIGMQVLVAMDGDLEKEDSQSASLNFVRVDSAEQEAETKDREQPDPPPEPEPSPETPDASVESDQPDTSQQLSMDMPSMDASVSQGEGMSLEGLSAGDGGGLSGFSSDAVPTLRVPPNYPQKAKRAGLEGYVTMAVDIRADGTVASVEVLESEPPRMFDDAAVRAMKRWRFRPKTENGENRPQKARQTIEFTLDK